MVCRGVVCDACRKACERDHQKHKGGFSPVVARFFKVIFDKDYSKLMYLPPVIARTVKHLTDKEIELEDSSGRQWPVTLSRIDGSLAFHKGWHKFFKDHSLKKGQPLIFNYIEGSHFIVQIFALNTLEIICGNDEISPPSKRSRTDQHTAPADVYLGGKPTSATALEHCSSKTNFPEEETGNFEDPICIMNRDDTGFGGDRNLIYDLSCFETAETSDAKKTPQKASITTLDLHHTENAKQDVNVATASDVKMALSGIRQPPKPVSKDPMEYTKAPVKDAEKTVIETGLFTSNFGDISINNLPERKPVVKAKFGEFPFSSSFEKKPPVVPNHAQKIIPPVKLEVVSDETGPCTTDYFSLCSFSAKLKSRFYLELPIPIGPSRGCKPRVKGIVVFLRDSIRRIWPVVYREYYGGRALTGNWSKFCEENNIRRGDMCRFLAVDAASRTYRVDVVKCK